MPIQHPPYPFQSESLPIAQLLARLGLATDRPSDEDAVIHGVNNLQASLAQDLAYISHIKNIDLLPDCRAQFCLINHKTKEAIDKRFESLPIHFIISPHPKRDWVRSAYLLYPSYPLIAQHQEEPSIDADVIIGKNTVIDENSSIASQTQIGHNCTISNSAIGKNCHIENNVILQNCSIGDDCIISSGVVIGSAGFGILNDTDSQQLLNIPQLGNVIIGRRCLVGANSAIDRATVSSTVIGDDCKIDNLVQIGHNAILGNNCVIAAGCALAGSCKIGHNVVLSGMCGVSDNVSIADGVTAGGSTIIFKDVVEADSRIWGIPARSLIEQSRLNILLDRMVKK